MQSLSTFIKYGIMIKKEMNSLLSLQEVLISITWGAVLGLLAVIANYRIISIYKEDYKHWWTFKKYIVLFFIVFTFVTFLSLIRYL